MSRCNRCSRILVQPRRARRAHDVPRIAHALARHVLEQTVARAFTVRAVDLWSGTRGRSRVALARQVAMYLAHVAWGLSLTEVGHLFARDRTTAAHACVQVEDLRDDADFDRCIDLLEGVLRALSLASLPPTARWHAEF